MKMKQFFDCGCPFLVFRFGANGKILENHFAKWFSLLNFLVVKVANVCMKNSLLEHIFFD